MSSVVTDRVVSRGGGFVAVANLVASGPVVLTGDVNVTGDQVVDGDSSIGGDMTVNADSLFSGNLDVVGALNVTSAATAGSTLNVAGDCTVGGTLNITGNINIARPSSILSTTANQLTVGYNGANKVLMDVSATGDLTIDCSGNDLKFADTDAVHVLGTTASSTPTNGALVVSGGLVVDGAVNAGAPLSIVSTAANQLTLGYNATSKVTFNVSSGGVLAVDCSGNDMNFDNTDTVHVLGVTGSASMTSGTLVLDGGMGAGGLVNAGMGLNSNSAVAAGALEVADYVTSAGFRCSGRHSMTAEYPTGTSGAYTIVAGSPSIDRSKIKIPSGAYLRWPSSTQIDGGATGTYHAKFTPGYNGFVPGMNMVFGGIRTGTNSKIIIYHSGGATFVVDIENSTGGAMITSISTPLSVVAGTEYEFLLSWNLAVAAGAACCKLWINGVLQATAVLNISAGSRATNPTYLTIASDGGATGYFWVRDICVWPTVTPYWNDTVIRGYTPWPAVDAPYVRASTQLEVRNATDLTKNATMVVDTNGDLTVDCSGNDLNFASTDAVHALGGLTVARSMACGGPVGSSGVLILPASYTGVCTVYVSGYTSLNADFIAGTGPLTATTTGTVALSSGKISIPSGSTIFWPYSTTCDGGSTVAMRCKFTPSYSGAPGGGAYARFLTMIRLAGGADNMIQFYHRADGNLVLQCYTSGGWSISEYAAWSPVAGQEYELEANIGASAQTVYIDGVRVIDAALAIPRVGDTGQLYCDANISGFAVRDLMLFTSIQHTGASYTPGYIPATNAIDTPLMRLAGNLEIRNTTNWASNAVFSVGTTGDLSVDCSGNDFYFANTDNVHLLGGALYLPTAGVGTAAPLSYYETFTSTALSLSGPWTSAQSIVLVIDKIGKSVTIGWAGFSSSADGTACEIASAAGAIPTRFLPAEDIFLHTYVTDGGNLAKGSIEITQGTGAITFYVSPQDPFQAGAFVAGVPNGSITYLAAA